jgi:hypothetical protein
MKLRCLVDRAPNTIYYDHPILIYSDITTINFKNLLVQSYLRLAHCYDYTHINDPENDNIKRFTNHILKIVNGCFYDDVAKFIEHYDIIYDMLVILYDGDLKKLYYMIMYSIYDMEIDNPYKMSARKETIVRLYDLYCESELAKLQLPDDIISLIKRYL